MNFILYLISSVTSIVGSGIQSIIIPLYILKVTGSGLQMAKAASIFGIISLIMGPIGGALADKFNRKHILIICDFLSFSTLVILLLSKKNNINGIIAMQGVLIIISSCFSASSTAIFSELDSLDKVEKNNNIYNGVISFIGLFTPILGLALYGFVELKIIFFFNGLTFLISAISEFFIKYTFKKKEKKEIKENVLKLYNPVIKYLLEKKDLMGISLYAVVINFVFTPTFIVLIPYFIIKKLSLNNIYIGYFETTLGIGMIIGNLILGKYSNKINFKSKIVFFITSRMLIFILLINMDLFFKEPYYIYLNAILIFLEGILSTLVNVPLFSYLHKEVHNEVKGRFFSLLNMIFQSTVPFGLIIFGFLLDIKFDVRVIVTYSFMSIIVFTYIYFYKTNIGKLFLQETKN